MLCGSRMNIIIENESRVNLAYGAKLRGLDLVITIRDMNSSPDYPIERDSRIVVPEVTRWPEDVLRFPATAFAARPRSKA